MQRILGNFMTRNLLSAWTEPRLQMLYPWYVRLVHADFKKVSDINQAARLAVFPADHPSLRPSERSDLGDHQRLQHGNKEGRHQEDHRGRSGLRSPGGQILRLYQVQSNRMTAATLTCRQRALCVVKVKLFTWTFDSPLPLINYYR